MSTTAAFCPQGSTVLVTNAAVQVPGEATGGVAQSYRVRNLASTPQYFTWGATNAVTSVGAPTAGVPSANTIGMLGSSVETFVINAPGAGTLWFIASTATGFEFTPGEGL